MHTSRFNTDKKCRDFLFQMKWDGKPACPKCGNNTMNYYISTRKVYKCSSCYRQFSLTQGTIFERSKIPLTKWFLAIYIFTTKKRGVSSIQMGKWLGVKQQTAWFMMHRLREALKEENNIILSGIVEGDETYINPKVNRDKRLLAKKKAHDEEQEKRDKVHGYDRKRRERYGIKLKRGRKAGTTKEVVQQQLIERGGKKYSSRTPSNRTPFEKGTVVLGMSEQKEGGRLVMKKLGINAKSVTKENIFPHLQNHISKDSTFMTDQLNLYKTTNEFFKKHLSVNHMIGHVINGVHVQNIENAWKHLKKMIEGTYFHLSHKHFDRYLDENTFRWNRRGDSLESTFKSFMPLTIGKRLTYEELIEEKMAA